jgi:hypothetical protein
MSADRAAAYCDLSKTKFLEGVDKGIWPAPKDADGVPRWDRLDLDAAWDALDARKKSSARRKTADELLEMNGIGRATNGNAAARQTTPMVPAKPMTWFDKTKPLGKLELRALEGYYRSRGRTTQVNGVGLTTIGRLEARGFIATTCEVFGLSDHAITPAGEAAWLDHCRRSAPSKGE